MVLVVNCRNSCPRRQPYWVINVRILVITGLINGRTVVGMNSRKPLPKSNVMVPVIGEANWTSENLGVEP